MDWNSVLATIAATLAAAAAVFQASRAAYGWLSSDAHVARIEKGVRRRNDTLARLQDAVELGFFDEARELEVRAFRFAAHPFAAAEFHRRHPWIRFLDFVLFFGIVAVIPVFLLAAIGPYWAVYVAVPVIVTCVFVLCVFLSTTMWEDVQVRKLSFEMAEVARTTYTGSCERSVPEGPSSWRKG